MKQNKAATLPILNLLTVFSHCILMDTKCPLNAASGENHFLYVIVDHFGIYIVTLPTLKFIAPNSVNSISKNGPP